MKRSKTPVYILSLSVFSAAVGLPRSSIKPGEYLKDHPSNVHHERGAAVVGTLSTPHVLFNTFIKGFFHFWALVLTLD